MLDAEQKKQDVILEKETVSIDNLTSSPADLKVINNPFGKTISCNLHTTENVGKIRVSLYDANGKLYKKTELESSLGDNYFYLTTEELSNGLYILQIQSPQFTLRKKLIKQ